MPLLHNAQKRYAAWHKLSIYTLFGLLAVKTKDDGRKDVTFKSQLVT
jgi:hypothetical protein